VGEVNTIDRYRQGLQVIDTARLFYGVLLLPIDDPWDTLEAGLASFEPGFVIERHQPDEQHRDAMNP
jgi:hypothetical protein